MTFFAVECALPYFGQKVDLAGSVRPELIIRETKVETGMGPEVFPEFFAC
jgi:hypothetical protein